MLGPYRSALFSIPVLVVAFAGCDPVRPAADAAPDDEPDGATIDAEAPMPDATPAPCSGDVAQDEYLSCLKNTVCDMYRDCFGVFVDEMDCQQAEVFFFRLYGEVVESSLLVELVDEGRLTYDAGAARACLDQMNGLTCPQVLAEPWRDCPVFVGSLNDGAACYHHLECAGPDARCDGIGGQCVDACCVGTCVDAAAIGESCTDRHCASGDHCVNDTCENGEGGAPCTGHFSCDEDYFCNQGTCALDFSEGSSCAENAQCTRPQTCVDGICQESFQVGDPCTTSGGCSPRDLYCDQPDETAPGTCRELPGDGQDCTANERCGAGLFCDDTDLVCRPVAAESEACGGSSECRFSLFCDTEISNQTSGTCLAPQPDGESCNDEDQCASQYCNANGQCATWPDCI